MPLTDSLAGSWEISRLIDDLKNDIHHDWNGSAVFIPQSGDLLYEEIGSLALAETNLATSRSYLYVSTGPWTMDVFFDDNRPFHDLDLETGMWKCRHLCGDDVYEGEFGLNDEELGVTWNIAGPQKDLRVTSLFKKSGGGTG